MLGEFPVASFSPWTSRIWSGADTPAYRFFCKKHGETTYVVYYEASKSPVLACPTCLRVHLDDKIMDGVERQFSTEGNVLLCEHGSGCSATTNLEQCDNCGREMCPTHRIESTCETCANESQFLEGYYSGL